MVFWWVGQQYCGDDLRATYAEYFGESISLPTLYKGRDELTKRGNVLRRFAAFLYYSGAAVEDAYDWFVDKVSLNKYWFGQRDELLGLLSVAKKFVDDYQQWPEQIEGSNEYEIIHDPIPVYCPIHSADRNQIKRLRRKYHAKRPLPLAS